MKKKILFFTLAFLTFNIFAATNNSAQKANQRTALRCLSLAKGYTAEKNWNAVISQSTLGIAYDENISDLWYLSALAKANLESPFAEILPLVQNALQKDNWVDYNRDNARLMYADILCDTGAFFLVPNILDEEPMIYSADAEYVRAKAYYRMKDADSISKARIKIDSARKMYPSDTRFPLLFFMNESPLSRDTDVIRLANIFISQITQYVAASPDKDAELEIYAASFATGDTKEHLLKSFKARDLRHPMYATVALNSNLITQKEAFNYIADFADSSISLSILENFLQLLTDDETIKNAKEYFNSYSGIIYTDTDDDGIENIHIKYERGRPATIFYDHNQDGIFEWTITCDFGTPVALSQKERNMSVTWENFPYLKTVNFENSKENIRQTFNLVSETLKWTPVLMSDRNKISSSLSMQFFFPEILTKGEEITNEMLINSSYSFTIPSEERQGATITFTLLNGAVNTAIYEAQGRQYAFAEFKNSVPVLRMVDADDDGVFETTEFYDIDTEGKRNAHSLEDERLVMTNLFGLPSNNASFYLRMIQIDTNEDTVPDFTEEYKENGKVITSWDSNGDGLWETRFINTPEEDLQESLFYIQPENSLVQIASKNGKPFKVSKDEYSLTVTEDKTEKNFFWLGAVGNKEIAKKSVEILNQNAPQGVCYIVEHKNERLLCIKVGSVNYGILIEQEALKNDEPIQYEE